MVTIKLNLGAQRKRSRSADTYNDPDEDLGSASNSSEIEDSQGFNGPPAISAGYTQAPPKRKRGRPPKRPRIEDMQYSNNSGMDSPMSAGTPAPGDDFSVDSPLPSTSFLPAPRASTASGAVSPASRFDRKTMKTVEGKVYRIEGDELALAENEVGEGKIDQDGNLLGGREFKFATFTSSSRANPNRRYCLSIDAARMAGYRDSLYFFRKHPLVHKLNCVQGEKELLIQQGKLHPNLRSRAVTMVTAHNLFKLFGSKFIKNGKHVTDDYDEVAALASGAIKDTPAYHEAYVKTDGLATGKGTEDVYSQKNLGGRPTGASMPRDLNTGDVIKIQFGGHGLAPFAKWDPASRQRKPGKELDVENWMFEYAKMVAGQNKAIRGWRKGHWTQLDGWPEAEDAQDKPRGTVDAHTSIPHVFVASQPTRAKIEREGDAPQIEGADGKLAAKYGFSSVAVECSSWLPQDEYEVYDTEKRTRWLVPGGFEFPTEGFE